MRAATASPQGDADAGFSLIEVMVALAILAVVLTASSVQFIGALKAGKRQQQRTQAVSLADQAIEVARDAVPTKLLWGRTQTAIDTQWASPGPINLTQSIKPTAPGSGTTETIPSTAQTVTIKGTAFAVNTIIGQCYIPVSATTNCTKTSSTGATLIYRASVSVTWTGGSGCSGANGQCSVVEATLVDPSVDPLFNNNNG
jgi:prepilin-type N-terminal cleavage/methylation domain-containing protein